MDWTTTPKARRDYRCDWCREPIEKGTQYVCVKGIDMGKVVTTRMHGECYRATEDLDEDEEWFNVVHYRGTATGID